VKTGKNCFIHLVCRWLDEERTLCVQPPKKAAIDISKKLEETIVMGTHHGLQAVMNWGFNAH
jgi:hypothetical protein